MLYDFVLSLHVFVAVCAFTLAGALHTSELLMRHATSVAELRTLTKPGRFGPAFGVIVVLLFGLGSWLIHLSPADEKFHFKDPFIWTASIVVVFLFATGPTIMGRHHTKLTKALADTPDGPIPSELRAFALDPVPTMTGWVSTMLALGVVFNMANKPSTGVAIVVILGGAAVGAALGWLTSRPVASALAPEAAS